MHGEQRVEGRFERGQNHRHVFWFAAGHHGIDRDLLHRALRQIRRHQADPLIAGGRLVPDNIRRIRSSVGGTTGKPSAPAPVKAGLDGVVPLTDLDSAALQVRIAELRHQVAPTLQADAFSIRNRGCKQADRNLNRLSR